VSNVLARAVRFDDIDAEKAAVKLYEDADPSKLAQDYIEPK